MTIISAKGKYDYRMPIKCFYLKNTYSSVYNRKFLLTTGGRNHYASEDCQLNDSQDTKGCDGFYNNLQFYARVECDKTPKEEGKRQIRIA